MMLLLLLGVFVFPVVIGLVLYFADWRPGGKSYGELLQPSHPLNIQPLQTVQGKLFNVADWRGKWHLVVVTSGGCDSDCQKDLVMVRQVHAALGKELDRVQRILVVSGVAQPEVLKAVQMQYRDLVILPEAGALARQFELTGNNGVYLVDPLGNLFMRYPKKTNPNGLRKDLIRLLTYSWTG
jgi:glutathione peroxidase-family protein